MNRGAIALRFAVQEEDSHMNYRDLDLDFYSMLLEEPDKYERDYCEVKEQVANSTAIYRGKPVPFLLHPMLWTERDVQAFQDISTKIISITDKVTDAYLSSPDFRQLFGYSELAEKLILREKGYARNTPIGRFDLFYEDPEHFYFCEINTDGSSAMNEDNEIGRILLQSHAVQDFSKKYRIEGFELLDSWVTQLLRYYEEWGGEGVPNVAIVDFKESATSSEFQVFQKKLRERGCACEIVDPRDVCLRDGVMYAGDFRIDLVYRRLVTFELLERVEEIPVFLEAYLANCFCCVGEIRSQVIHNKRSFAVLHSEEAGAFLTESEREFVQRHIPKTEVLTSEESLLKKVRDNRERYVLKPSDKNASQGVLIGMDLTDSEWREKVDACAGRDYLLQDFCPPVLRKHSVFEDGEWRLKEFGSVVGLFIYDGRFQGIYTRVSSQLLISGISDYYTLPNMCCRKIGESEDVGDENKQSS